MTRGYPNQSTLSLIAAAALLAAISLASSPASAAYVTVYGGATYDAATQTGYLLPGLPVSPGRTAGNGVAVGHATKYTNGASLGPRAVRWDASGTAATELGNLGTDSGGYTYNVAWAVNTAGTAVGYAEKYGDFSLGYVYRAVRWDASGSAATELGGLAIGSSDTFSQAYAVNTAGFTVGYAQTFTSSGTFLGSRATLWDLDGVAFDLNTLIDPNSGWTLDYGRGISDTNWVTGIGGFDPDGAGPLAAYNRAFLLDVSSAVPEPSSLALLTFVVPALLRRRHQSRQRPQEAVTRPSAWGERRLTSS
jgi:hypothetical protein